MKQVNKNLVITVILFAMIATGTVSIDLFNNVKSNVYELIYNTENIGLFDRINNFFDGVETSSNDVSYHDRCLDVNSFVLNKTNRKVVEKSDETVVKMDNGYLAFASEKTDEESRKEKQKLMGEAVNNMSKLNDFLTNKNIPLTYVYIPVKGYDGGFPEIKNNYISEDAKSLTNSIKNEKINVINLKEKMEEEDISESDAFFATDHHWKPKTGFWATKIICEDLREKYGLNYNKKYIDIQNYQINTYDYLFLGSQGKKVGAYFTNYKCESIDVITPKFSTDFNVVINGIEEISGDYNEVFIYDEWLEKDLYNINNYAAYCGNNYAEQKIENKLLKEGESVLIIQDSFSNTIKPFLSNVFSTVYSLDIRSDFVYGERISSVTDYIEEVHPDYVIILYSGATFSDTQKYDLR